MLTSHMLKTVGIIAVIGSVILVTSSYAFGLLTNQRTVDTTGILNSVDIGVYSDAACTQNKTTINWGGCNPGDNKTAALYIKNLGTNGFTLSTQTLNWNPSTASQYFTLSSNYGGQTLTPGQVLPVTLTLRVSRSISDQITTFSFSIAIISQG